MSPVTAVAAEAESPAAAASEKGKGKGKEKEKADVKKAESAQEAKAEIEGGKAGKKEKKEKKRKAAVGDEVVAEVRRFIYVFATSPLKMWKSGWRAAKEEKGQTCRHRGRCSCSAVSR